jgi:hypothetical protein
VHFYPRKGQVDAALDALKVYEIGKPLVIEEMFPLNCSLDELDAFIKKSRAYTDGWISFYWGKNHQGVRKGQQLDGSPDDQVAAVLSRELTDEIRFGYLRS